ncbi:MAG: septation regulator SpoVG [Actinomycetia bacterium]|nr:septation regulator SpoVG [Actinomycetes bacterium]
MNITKVIVRQVERMNRVRAMASVTFDDNFVIHDIRVVEGSKGLFIAMPSRRLPNGSYRDIVHPTNSETRDEIQDIILEEYEKGLQQIQ